MELIVIGLVCFIASLARIINFKVNYVTHYAICLDYTTGHYAFTSFPLYEYEMIEAGVKVVYKNTGTAFFYPRKGKRHKVLIHKSNHNKIVGYSEYILNLILTFLISICLLSQIIFI